MGDRLSIGGRVDRHIRLIFLVLALFGFACESNAYGTVASGPATVGSYPARIFGQSNNGKVSCTSGCTDSYQSATEAGIAARKATQSASFPSSTYGATTYTTIATSPPGVRASVVASFTGQSGPTSTTLTSDATVFCEDYPTGTHRTATGSVPNFVCYGTIPPTCPSNSSFVGSSCVCSTNYKPNLGSTACELITSTACSTIASSYTLLGATLQGGTFKSLTFCNSGCVLTASEGFGTNGDWWLTGSFSATGANCDGTSAQTGSDADLDNTPPAAGYCSGTVNGTSVTVPCSDTVSRDDSKTTSSATSASGVTSTGSTTTESTTTSCSRGTCSSTTTATTTNPDGSTSTTKKDETKPKPEDEFCKQNPNLSICKNSNISTTCTAGSASVTCDGDAIQCAIAKEQVRRACELFEKTSPQSDLGLSSILAGDQPGDHPHKQGQTENLSFTSRISQTNLIAGSCPADVSVSMGGSFPPVVLPFSKVCEPAAILGNVGVGFAFLVCLFIVFKRD